MTEAELNEALRRHALWLADDPDGKRADLRGADLSGADLRGAKGLICLHVIHPAGYRPVAVEHGESWRIFAGCRSFTVAKALAHWGSPEYHTPELGAAYVRAIKEQLT